MNIFLADDKVDPSEKMINRVQTQILGSYPCLFKMALYRICAFQIVRKSNLMVLK